MSWTPPILTLPSDKGSIFRHATFMWTRQTLIGASISVLLMTAAFFIARPTPEQRIRLKQLDLQTTPLDGTADQQKARWMRLIRFIPTLPSDNRSILCLSWWLSSKPVRWVDSTPIHAALVFCGSQSRHPKISHSTAVIHIQVAQIWYLIWRARNSAGIPRKPEAMG